MAIDPVKTTHPLSPLSPGNRLFYRLQRLLCIPFLKIFYGFTVEGPLPPDQGPVIVAANHESMMDPVVLQAAVKNRRLIYLMSSDYYFLPALNRYSRTMRAVPVMEGRFNRDAIRSTIEVLEARKAVGIFPQGEIRATPGDLGDGMRGIALLAEKSKVPVVPVRIRGTGKALPRGRRFFRRSKISVHFGAALRYEEMDSSDPLSRHATLSVITDRIMTSINSL